MSAALEQVADLVRRETGIWMKGAQLTSLEAALGRIAPEMDAGAFLRAGGDRTAGAQLMSRLIDEVSVNETFFFRQRKELDAIDWRALLDAARAAGSETVRVWVAACSSGEEAYTLAILASEAFGTARPPVSILATDISTAILDRARAGRYGRRALRALDGDTIGRRFVPDGDGIAVGEPLRQLVQLRRHNLLADPAPPLGERPFDLITCRNVLIYFDGDTVERVIGSLEGALSPQGMLVLGAADRLCGSARRLASVDAAAVPHAPRREPARTLRRPLGRQPAHAPAPAAPEPDAGAARPGLAEALRAANAGELDVALEATARLLEDDPLDAEAHFVRGLAQLSLGDADSAVGSLRRALYVEPTFGLAAFKLGRAQEERGDGAAAARAYEQALRTLDPDDVRHAAVLEQVDVDDVATACTLRLKALRAAGVRTGETR